MHVLDAAGKHDVGVRGASELPPGGAKAGCDGTIISASGRLGASGLGESTCDGPFDELFTEPLGLPHLESIPEQGTQESSSRI